MNEKKVFGVQDLAAWIKKEPVADYTCVYEPEYFWKELGKVYIETFKNADGQLKDDALSLNIKCLIPRIGGIKPDTILEVGCGFGRCLSYVAHNIKEAKKIYGVEFSKTMIEQAKVFFEHIDAKNLDKVQILNAKAQALPFQDKSMDVVYSHVCLTHIPPEDIEQVTSEISRVAKHWIFHIERFNFPYEHPNPHRWSHMLPPYYIKLGWKVHECDYVNPEHKTILLTLRR